MSTTSAGAKPSPRPSGPAKSCRGPASRATRASEAQSAYVAGLFTSQKTELDALDNVKATGAAQADFEAFKEGVKARMEAIGRVASADSANLQSALTAATPAAEAAARRVAAAARRLGVEGCP